MNKNTNITKPLLIVLSALSLCISCTSNSEKRIHAPIKSPSEIASTGTETKWSRVEFGSYPAREIVTSSWNAIDGYALQEGDVLISDKLHKTLEEGNWNNDSLSLDGVTYIREKHSSNDDSEQHYRHDDDYHYFEVQPLKWRVLDISGGKITLLSDKTIDCVPFQSESTPTNWSSSSLRAWLNDEKNGFYAKAFDANEKKLIAKSENENADNPSYGTSSGPSTEDYVYLLSNEEVFASQKGDAYGFYAGSGYDDSAKRFASTTYAKFHGTWWSPVGPYRGNSFWCMRTSGYTSLTATYICDFGYIYARGTSVDCPDAGVLPVIQIKADAKYFSSFDEVSSLAIMKDASGEEKENTCDPDAKKQTHGVIEFGSYPQDEVVPSLPTSNGQEGYIVDDGLYAELSNADWTADVYIEGTEYKNLDDHYFAVQPIVWNVLSTSEGSSLLFPTKGLDSLPYNDTLKNVHWSDSSLRGWLNGDFLASAFKEEANRIQETKVKNNNNFYFNTSCGQETTDKVFLLSEEEVFCSALASSYGFACSDAIYDEARQIKPSRYALARGAWASKEDGNGFWMLRTNGYNSSNAVYVGNVGDIYNRGIPVTTKDAIVMPALWVK